MTTGIAQLMQKVEGVRDSFHTALFETQDLAAATEIAAPTCTMVNLPAGTGTVAGASLERFLSEDLLPYLPDDLSFTRVSRTGDRWQVADELTVTFTHDRPMPWLLPGIEPTNGVVRVFAVTVVGVRHSRIVSHRTLWDHATLLTQLGLV